MGDIENDLVRGKREDRILHDIISLPKLWAHMGFMLWLPVSFRWMWTDGASQRLFGLLYRMDLFTPRSGILLAEVR